MLASRLMLRVCWLRTFMESNLLYVPQFPKIVSTYVPAQSCGWGGVPGAASPREVHH